MLSLPEILANVESMESESRRASQRQPIFHDARYYEGREAAYADVARMLRNYLARNLQEVETE